MDNFAEAVVAIHDLRESGVISEYAIGGAMGLSFWAEAVPTYDLDVFVQYESAELVMTLSPIFDWAKERNYAIEGDQILISGIPVQILPACNPLIREAVANAAELDYDGILIRVIRPEHLIAMFLDGSARSAKRLARVAMLLESKKVDRELLDGILARYNLKLPRFDDAN